MEGVGCFLTGICGPGVGVTSYSENIGAIALTKVRICCDIELPFCRLVVISRTLSITVKQTWYICLSVTTALLLQLFLSPTLVCRNEICEQT